MKAIGMRLWPIWTNDNSDYIAWVTHGPLAGAAAAVSHEEDSFLPVFRDLDSAIKAIKKTRKSGLEPDFDFPPSRKQKATAEEDWARVTAFADALKGKKLGDGARWAAQCIQNLAPLTHTKKVSPILQSLGLAKYDTLLPTKLRQAAWAGKLKLVKELVALEPPREALDEALGTAAESGRTAVVACLLEHGAAPEMGGEFMTALTRGARGGHEEIVKLLLDAGASLHPDWATHPLASSAFTGKLNTVKQLVAAGADVNAKSGTRGETALLEAAGRGREEIVLFLLEQGADVNAQGGEHGNTALHVAAKKGHVDLVKLLLENGADSKIVSAQGLTAHEYAMDGRHKGPEYDEARRLVQ